MSESLQGHLCDIKLYIFFFITKCRLEDPGCMYLPSFKILQLVTNNVSVCLKNLLYRIDKVGNDKCVTCYQYCLCDIQASYITVF